MSTDITPSVLPLNLKAWNICSLALCRTHVPSPPPEHVWTPIFTPTLRASHCNYQVCKRRRREWELHSLPWRENGPSDLGHDLSYYSYLPCATPNSQPKNIIKPTVADILEKRFLCKQTFWCILTFGPCQSPDGPALPGSLGHRDPVLQSLWRRWLILGNWLPGREQVGWLAYTRWLSRDGVSWFLAPLKDRHN